MRFPSFLVPVALFLSISSSISAESLMTGVWSNPDVDQDSSAYCCIPTSIQILSSESSSSYTANFDYPNYSRKCGKLFSGSVEGRLKVYKRSNSSDTETALSETISSGSMEFKFFASNSTGSPTLTIYSTSFSNQCNFTMKSRGDGGKSHLAVLVPIVIFMIIFIAYVVRRYKQSKQVDAILAENYAYKPVVEKPYTAPKRIPKLQPGQQILYFPGGYVIAGPATK